MKKKILALVLALAIIVLPVLTSCQKDDGK